MAKIIITLEDSPSGDVTVTNDYLPELGTEARETNAQSLAADLLNYIATGETFLGVLGKVKR